jgi:dTDP-4-dehydrorhamnose 3,5-epimerase-like enzyme
LKTLISYTLKKKLVCLQFLFNRAIQIQRDVFLRGLYYSFPLAAQGKPVRFVQGGGLDIALDVSKKSKKIGKCTCEVLSDIDKQEPYLISTDLFNNS